MSSEKDNNLLESLDYSFIQQCMHCGMCLPTCPTYDETLRESHSPRGRISLMRDIVDGSLPISEAFGEEMYYCLGCLACQTACPAGVDYAELFEKSRAEIERQEVLSTPSRRLIRWLSLVVLFRQPRILRFTGWCLWLFQRSGVMWFLSKRVPSLLLPKKLRRLLPLTPTMRPPFSNRRIAPRETPENPKYRVGMLTGCVQDLMYSTINRDTVDVLLHNGNEVITPQVQFCCGSLHAHNGDLTSAKYLAKKTLDSFDLDNLDAIITNAGGCGSHLKRYAPLLEGDEEYYERALHWDRKVKDIQEWLEETGFLVPENSGNNKSRTVAYDDSCHLCHGQGVSSQPRNILRSIPGITLVELPEADWCCGSAGIYSITQPEQAEKLLTRKLQHLEGTGATTVASANPGCLLQLSNGVAQRPNLSRVEVTHPISLLAEAYSLERH